jgi:MFS family permease
MALSPHQRSYADTYQDAVAAPAQGREEVPLLQQFRFYRFLLSAFTANTGQNAVAYTLLIVVIDETSSGVFTSLFVLCSLLPVILFGLVAGIVVDHLPNKLILFVANLTRGLAVFLLLYWPTNVPMILLTVVVLWTVAQFSSPAANSALPALLPAHRYSSAAALIDLATLFAQLIGMVIFAPVMLKLFGPEPVYAGAAILYCAAAYIVFTIPRMTDQKAKVEEIQRERTQIKLFAALAAGWNMLRSDRVAFQAMVQYTLLSTATAILVVLVPQYTEEVVHTSAENLIYIFSPAALGLFIGLWLAPVLGRLKGNPLAATIGFAIFVVSIAGFAFSALVEEIILENGFVPIEEMADFFNISIAVVVTMLLALPAGMGAGMVGIAAKATLLERAPAEGRGRIFATQSWAAGVLSLIPIFIAGLISSVVDVRFAIFLLAFALAAIALYARFGLEQRPLSSPLPS